MHLKLCMISAHYSGNNRHPQIIMKELGITYQHATPQSISDSWWFWNCESIPKELPNYLTELKVDPYKCIGYGLSKENAKKIAEYKLNKI